MLGLKHVSDPIEIADHSGSTVEEVYQDFILKHLRRGHIAILHFAGKGLIDPNCGPQLNQIDCKLPTWVSDWRSLNDLVPLTRIMDEAFNAATNLLPFLCAEEDTLPFIGLAGVQIGIVEEEISTLFLNLNR